eukprot:s3795_g1.t1
MTLVAATGSTMAMRHVQDVLALIDRWGAAIRRLDAIQAEYDTAASLLGFDEQAGVYFQCRFAGAEYEVMSELQACRNSLQELLLRQDASKSLRVQFLGSHAKDTKSPVVVSFPGVHGLAWTFLTTLPNAMPTSEVRFLQDCSYRYETITINDLSCRLLVDLEEPSQASSVLQEVEGVLRRLL